MSPGSHAAAPRSDAPRGQLTDAAIVLLLLAALYPAHLFGSATLDTVRAWSDLLHLAQPTFEHTGRALAQGELPLWNPYWFAGFPHLAVPSNAVFYPTTLLFGRLPFAAAVKIVAFGHLWIFGLGGYALGRALGGHRLVGLVLAAQLMGGRTALWMLGFGHPWELMTLAWLPFLVLLLRRLLARPEVATALLFATTLALMILGGDANTLVMALYALAVYAAVDLVVAGLRGRRTAGAIAARAGAVAGAVTLAVGLAAVQVLPARELLAESIRGAGIAYEYMAQFAATWPQYLRALLHFDPSATAVGPGIQVGRSAAALAVAGVLARPRREGIALAAAAACCLVFSILPEALHRHLVSHLPLLAGIRGVVRVTWLWLFLVHLLAALGLGAILAPGVEPADRRRSALRAGAAAAALVGAPLAAGAPPDPLALAGLACLLLAAWRLRRGSRPPAWLAALLVIQLAATVVTIRLAEETTGPVGRYRVSRDFLALSEHRHGGRLAVFAPWPSRTLVHRQAVGLLTRDRVLGGSHALMLERYARLLQAVGGLDWLAERNARGELVADGLARLDRDWIDRRSLRLLDLLGVRHLVSDGVELRLPARLAEAGRRFRRFRIGRLTVYENANAFPPAFTVHRAVVASGEEALARLAVPDFPLREAVTVPAPFDPSQVAPASGPEPVEIAAYRPGEIDLAVTMTAPGLLVVSEMCYPGWRVTIDGGAPRDALCLDEALNGTLLDRGRHRVRFLFRPRSVRRGAALSGLGVALLVAGVGWEVVRRRR